MSRQRTKPDPSKVFHSDVPYPERMPINIFYDDNDGMETNCMTLFENFSTSTLLRFSASARRQILEAGCKSFDISSSNIGWHPAIQDCLETVVTYITEMSHVPRSSVRAPFTPPMMFSWFAHGLQHAMICLEIVKEFELDEPYKQDDWIRKWILHWVTKYDVLPHEVYCAWHLFRFDAVDKAILDLLVDKVVKDWDQNSLYFLKGQERWIHDTQIKDRGLWGRVREEMDKKRGSGSFKALWSYATAKKNIRARDWDRGLNFDLTINDRASALVRCKMMRDGLQAKRNHHCHILHEILNAQPPIMSPLQYEKFNLRDGKWIVEEKYNEYGHRIRRWSSIG